MTIRSLICAAPVLVAAWLAVLSAMTFATDDAPGIVVLFPSQSFADNLPDGAALVGRTAFSLTLASDQTGFAAALFHSGARLILPAGLPGCAAIAQG